MLLLLLLLLLLILLLLVLVLLLVLSMHNQCICFMYLFALFVYNIMHLYVTTLYRGIKNIYVTYQAETERLQCVCVEPLHLLHGDGNVSILNGHVGFIRPILGAFHLKPHFVCH